MTYGNHFERRNSSIDVREEIDSEVSVSKDTSNKKRKEEKRREEKIDFPN